MKINMRRATREDAAVLGQINYDAFKKIADEHNFPSDFPSVEDAVRTVTSLISSPGFYSVLAEVDGKIAGSNFMDERNPIAGIGPISVDPAVQNQTIGRHLMENALERVRARNPAGVRLVQTAYHNRSLCLYTKLGFETREPLSVMQGNPLNLKMPGYDVRRANAEDLEACNRLCARVHGHHRGGELRDAIRSDGATVVERLGRITGYATAIVQILKREKARREETLMFARKGNRKDLVDQNEAELRIIESYLPAGIGEDELRATVKEAIAGGATQIGTLMKTLRDKFGARLDGKMASEIVKQEIAAKS